MAGGRISGLGVGVEVGVGTGCLGGTVGVGEDVGEGESEAHPVAKRPTVTAMVLRSLIKVSSNKEAGTKREDANHEIERCSDDPEHQAGRREPSVWGSLPGMSTADRTESDHKDELDQGEDSPPAEHDARDAEDAAGDCEAIALMDNGRGGPSP